MTLLLLATALTAGCDGSDLEDLDDLEFRDSSGQSGPPLNTSVIFTSEVAAVDTQGQALDGVTLVGVDIKQGLTFTAIDFGSLDVDHGTLRAQVGGQDVEGVDFIDSVWSFDVEGDTITAVLTVVETSSAAGLWQPNDPNTLRMLDPHRLVYTFKWSDIHGTHTTCEEDSVAGARAVIYKDIVVDYDLGTISARANTVYIGCISGAVGKAALWGYAPDSPSKPSLSLPAFTTATRMVRADYCADGMPHTVAGNPVGMRDRWAINGFPPAGFGTEAVWEAGGGAKCIRRDRLTGAVFVASPMCWSGKLIPLCVNDGMLENKWTNQNYGDFWSKIPLIP